MHISFIEIQNFRRLKSIRIDISEKTTVFVGANNSGKTSAMIALRHFLVDHGHFIINDFTLSSWAKINEIGVIWEGEGDESRPEGPTLSVWEPILPFIDVWLRITKREIHHVAHLLPTLDWTGGLLGVRLRLEPKNIEDFYKEYLVARKAARETAEAASELTDKNVSAILWPADMRGFLERRLNLFGLRAHLLDSSKIANPVNGIARPQPLDASNEPLDVDPFEGLIRVDEISAQRGFSDAAGQHARTSADGAEGPERIDRRRLSNQLQAYYAKHLDPSSSPDPSDLGALQAIEVAQGEFDRKLREGFSAALAELESLGYPGVTDPKLTISTRVRMTDGLNHASAVQYEINQQCAENAGSGLRLPEQYNGLGYQNLISMVFRLMSFRDDWMQVGKLAKTLRDQGREEYSPPPLHLVWWKSRKRTCMRRYSRYSYAEPMTCCAITIT